MAARDIEQLILQLSTDQRAFQRELLRVAGTADAAAKRIERSFAAANKKVEQDFRRFRDGVRNTLATLGVGFIVRDVVRLGDVWTRVGNALSTAGVEANQLAAVQQVVSDIAIRTRADLEATADLFARMLRASEDLGASMGDVAAATELVSKALAGAPESERAGAIRQLGQGLASGRLQGDELRSILENSRAIAEAIAAEFDTTVGQLRELGKTGQLESRRVFEAILNAAPEIEAAYDRTIATVGDSFNRLETVAARFVGTNDRTSAAMNGFKSLIAGVADNFELLADAVVVTATVLGGTFAGVAVARAIGALNTLTLATGAAATRAASLQSALTFLGGPLGIGLALVGTGMAFLATQTDVFTTSAERAARAGDSLYSALQVIAGLETVTAGAADATGELADETGRANQRIDELISGSRDTTEALTAQERATRALMIAERERNLNTLRAAQLDQRNIIAAEDRARDYRDFQRFLNTPIGGLDNENTRRNLARLDREDAAGTARRTQALEDELFIRQAIEALEAGRVQPGAQPAGQPPRPTPATPGGSAAQRNLENLRAQAALTLARLRHEEASVRAIEDGLEIQRRTSAYVEAGLSATQAQAEAEREVQAERAASNAEAQRGYEILQMQDQIELARIRGAAAYADALQDQLELRRRQRELVDNLAMSEADALKHAQRWVDQLREARAVELERELGLRDLEIDAEAARARGDVRAERAVRRRLELEARIRELRQMGVSDEAAIERATREIAELERADIQGKFRQWFVGGVTAALEGDLGGFFENWMRERAAEGLNNALNDVADAFFRLFEGVITGAMEEGGLGIEGILAGIFGGTGVKDLQDGAEVAAEALKTVLAGAAADSATKLALSGAAAAASAVKDQAAAVSKVQLITAEQIAAKAALQLAAALTKASAAANTGGGGGAGLFGGLLGNLLSGGWSSFSTGTGGWSFAPRATGGDVWPGRAYMVGEQGPEPFIPKVPGTILPNGAARAVNAGVSIVYAPKWNFVGTQAEFEELKAEMQAERRSFVANVHAAVDSGRPRRQVGWN